MRARICFLLIAFTILFSLTSCKTLHNAQRVEPEKAWEEGSVVFVRPTYHPALGVRSISDYVEVTYEEFGRNQGNLPEVKVGFRNKGGTRFYDRKGPDFQISVKTAFYKSPLPSQGGALSPPAYETNWQTLTLLRGDTSHYKSICPVADAAYYQVTVSELQK